MKKHIFVMMRYSVLTESKDSWRIGREKEFEEYKENLFSEERLGLHQELFEKVTLPSLLSMDAKSTTVLVFTSELLPGKFRDKLDAVVADYSWIKVIPLPIDGRVIKQMHDHLKEELKEIGEDLCYATVRLDDDDALSSDFYARLTKYIRPELSGHAVSFSSGFAGIYYRGSFERFYKIKQQKIALGLSFVQVYKPGSPMPNPISVYSLGNHTKIDDKVPLILDATKPMYIRTIHGQSDAYCQSLIKKVTSEEVLRSKDVERYFGSEVTIY